jgi:hypothetical protein
MSGAALDVVVNAARDANSSQNTVSSASSTTNPILATNSRRERARQAAW